MITTNIRTYATCPKCGHLVYAVNSVQWLHLTPNGFAYRNCPRT